MLRIINRVLAFGVATLVAAALFVTGVAIWSWWDPAAPQVGDDGRRLPAGYANFLIVNDLVLAPVYQTRADDIALRRLDDAFPRHRIEPVDCRALITQNGSLHCVTMNYPDFGAPT